MGSLVRSTYLVEIALSRGVEHTRTIVPFAIESSGSLRSSVRLGV